MERGGLLRPGEANAHHGQLLGHCGAKWDHKVAWFL